MPNTQFHDIIICVDDVTENGFTNVFSLHQAFEAAKIDSVYYSKPSYLRQLGWSWSDTFQQIRNNAVEDLIRKVSNIIHEKRNTGEQPYQIRCHFVGAKTGGTLARIIASDFYLWAKQLHKSNRDSIGFYYSLIECRNIKKTNSFWSEVKDSVFDNSLGNNYSFHLPPFPFLKRAVHAVAVRGDDSFLPIDHFLETVYGSAEPMRDVRAVIDEIWFGGATDSICYSQKILNYLVSNLPSDLAAKINKPVKAQTPSKDSPKNLNIRLPAVYKDGQPIFGGDRVNTPRFAIETLDKEERETCAYRCGEDIVSQPPSMLKEKSELRVFAPLADLSFAREEQPKKIAVRSSKKKSSALKCQG